jgi:carbonic anhydrase
LVCLPPYSHLHHEPTSNTSRALDDAVTLATERPTVDIPQQAVEFENLGTTIEVIVNGTTSFAGSDFRLRQFHIHTPSEHRIGEEYFPLETHFVHEGVTDPNSIAVISLLFQLSSNASTPLISGLRPHLAAIATPGTKTSIEGGLDFSAMLTHLATSDIFQYSGSLTTPPCSEGITFLVAKSPLPIDVETYNSIKSIVKFNSRYTQNTLGEENMIAVGNRSGTEEQFDPPAQEEEVAEDEAPPAEGETPAAVTPAPVITKGATVVISEIQGQPTSLLGVIVKGK